MRTQLIIISALFFIKAQATTIFTDSKVEAVTIYLNKAEVSRSAHMQLKRGEHELVFQGLSSHVDGSSIQVKGTGDFIILNTAFRPNYLNEEELPEELQSLKDSIGLFEKKASRIASSISSILSEEDLLKANKQVTGEDGISITDLKSISTYYQKRLEEIANKVFDLSIEKKMVQNRLNKLRQQYASRTASVNQKQGEVVVKLQVKNETRAQLDLSYVVYNAGWYPAYNLRSDGVTKNVTLEQYAVINQNTGENWANVNLSLSTQNTDRKQKPELHPWYLDIRQEYLSRPAPNQKSMAMGMVMNEMVQGDMAVSRAESSSDYVDRVENVLSVKYSLAIPYTIQNGTKEKRVAITSNDLKVDYRHYAVPKLVEDVFLTAEIKGWESLSLLPGQVNVFLDGGYVGDSFLDPTSLGENLIVSMGIDPSVLVERKTLNDFTDDQFIGNNRKRKFGYQLVVKNNKTEAIDIKILDQTPISKNDEISVTIEDLSAGMLNRQTGVVSWDKNMKPREETKLNLVYEVKYPKDKKLRGL